MRRILLTLYALLISVVVIALLYLVNPYVTEFPKTATIILALSMLTSFGTRVRSMLEISILWPMIKIADGKSKLFSVCPFVFLIALLVAIVIPWLNGVSDFNIWHWISSIAFTMFNFETFYAFIGATLRIYNTADEVEQEC